MPDTIANNGTAVPDMSRAAAKAIYPNGGRNRTAARVQAALLRGLVGLAAALTAAVLLFLIGYILVNGIPNLKPSLFAWEYNSENVSLMPALINTLLMTAFSLVIATPLGIFAAIWLVEYAHRGSKLVRLVRLTTETLQGIPSIVYGLFGMLFFVTQLHWGYSLISGAFTLAIMVLPVIMRTTEEALIAVPDSYRELDAPDPQEHLQLYPHAGRAYVPALQRGPVHQRDLRHRRGAAGTGAGHQLPVRLYRRQAGEEVTLRCL